MISNFKVRKNYLKQYVVNMLAMRWGIAPKKVLDSLVHLVFYPEMSQRQKTLLREFPDLKVWIHSFNIYKKVSYIFDDCVLKSSVWALETLSSKKYETLLFLLIFYCMGHLDTSLIWYNFFIDDIWKKEK